MPAAPDPLLGRRDVDLLRAALAGFTVDSVQVALGAQGAAAHARGDLLGAARGLASPSGAGDPRLVTLCRLFLLGVAVDEADAAAALDPLPLAAAEASGLVARSAGEVRALLDIRPYAEADAAGATGRPWWVVSDFGSDVRTGPLPADHVLGIGPASLTLAQSVPRDPVGRSLDIGTGSGVQALHLGTHAEHVVATDVSTRALRCAATTAALSGQEWDLRAGSLLEPVANERFDLVVANPPFVVSDGLGGHTYRDSGSPGDVVSARLVHDVAAALAPGGTAVLLANWIIPAGGSWQDRVGGWVEGTGCDAWVRQREAADPGEYVALWLRDAGELPGSDRWTARYSAWADWFARNGVAAVGMGLVVLWRTERADPVVVLEDVPQPVEQPSGALLGPWLRRQHWLADRTDAELLGEALRPAPDLVRLVAETAGPDGWHPRGAVLQLEGGLRWQAEVDDTLSALVAGLVAAPDLALPVSLLAAMQDTTEQAMADAVLPAVRELVARGFLLPRDLLAHDAVRSEPA